MDIVKETPQARLATLEARHRVSEAKGAVTYTAMLRRSARTVCEHGYLPIPEWCALRQGGPQSPQARDNHAKAVEEWERARSARMGDHYAALGAWADRHAVQFGQAVHLMAFEGRAVLEVVECLQKLRRVGQQHSFNSLGATLPPEWVPYEDIVPPPPGHIPNQD